MGLTQTLLDTIYPPTCAMCDVETVEPGALCPACWRDTPFIDDRSCRMCGAPLPGEVDDQTACDECLIAGHPWQAGRAALVYAGQARRLVLKIKHGDRLDLLQPAGRWMASAGSDLWDGTPLLVPVPAHWSRRIRRRYDQAALLARAVARETGHDLAVRAMVRVAATPLLDGLNRETRFDTLAGKIAPHRVHGAVLEGRTVVLIDDVMTSGATFAAATSAAQAAGAREVRVLALARVARDT